MSSEFCFFKNVVYCNPSPTGYAATVDRPGSTGHTKLILSESDRSSRLESDTVGLVRVSSGHATRSTITAPGTPAAACQLELEWPGHGHLVRLSGGRTAGVTPSWTGLPVRHPSRDSDSDASVLVAGGLGVPGGSLAAPGPAP